MKGNKQRRSPLLEYPGPGPKHGSPWVSIIVWLSVVLCVVALLADLVE